MPTDINRDDVRAFGLTDKAAEVESRMRAEGWDVSIAVNDQRVVLGLANREALASNPQALVEEVMRSGPTTLCPNWSLHETVDYLRQQQIESIVVTTSDGELIGILYLGDAERRLDEFHAAAKSQSPLL